MANTTIELWYKTSTSFATNGTDVLFNYNQSKRVPSFGIMEKVVAGCGCSFRPCDQRNVTIKLANGLTLGVWGEGTQIHGQEPSFGATSPYHPPVFTSDLSYPEHIGNQSTSDYMPIGKSGWGMGPTSGEGPWNVPSKAQQAMTEPSDDENNPEAKQHTHHHSPQSPNPNDEDRGNREGMWKHLEELSDSEGTSRQPTSEAEWEKYFDPTSPQPNRPRKRRVYQTHGHGRNKSIGEEQPSASSMQAPEPPKTSRRGLHQLEKEEDKPSEHEDDSDTEENSHHGEPQSQAPGDETHVDRDYHAPPGDRAALLSGEGNRKWKGSLLERDLRDRFSSGGPSRRSAPASDSNPFLAADPNQSNPPPRWVIGEPQLQPSRSEQIAEDMRFQDPRKAPKPPTTPSPYSAAHVHQEQAPALTVDVPELPTVRSLHSDQEQPAKTLSDAPEPPPTRKRGFRSMFGWAKKAFQ